MELIPAGFHFLPTDEELISYYLYNKINGLPLPRPCPVFDLPTCSSVYDTEPWNLFPNITPNKNIHVFSNLINTSTTSKRIRRVAGCETWKLESSTNIYEGYTRRLIGWRKLLTFEVKKKKEENKKIMAMKNVGSWIMHEFSLVGVTNFAVCEIKYKVSAKDEEFEEEEDQEDDLEAMLDNIDRKREREESDEPPEKRTKSSSCSSSSSSPQPQVDAVPEIDNELEMELLKLL